MFAKSNSLTIALIVKEKVNGPYKWKLEKVKIAGELYWSPVWITTMEIQIEPKDMIPQMNGIPMNSCEFFIWGILSPETNCMSVDARYWWRLTWNFQAERTSDFDGRNRRIWDTVSRSIFQVAHALLSFVMRNTVGVFFLRIDHVKNKRLIGWPVMSHHDIQYHVITLYQNFCFGSKSVVGSKRWKL